MTITTTSTRPPEALPDAEPAASRTVVRVAPDARGPLAVRTDSTSGPGRPRIRAVTLSTTRTAARLCLVPEGALLLAGDRVEVVVEVGEGVQVELIETAGTVAYDMRGDLARWDVDVTIGDGGALVWAGKPFVVATGADVRRLTRVELGAGARLALQETLVLGRHGEAPGRLRQELDIGGPGGKVLVEELAFDGASPPGILGGHRVLASVLALGVEIAAEAAPEHRYDFDGGGSWWRRLGHEAHLIGLEKAWEAAQCACRG